MPSAHRSQVTEVEPVENFAEAAYDDGSEGTVGEMSAGKSRPVVASGRMADRFLGASRPRFAAALISLLILGLAFAGLAITGQFSDIRHANIPWIHPYPPSGYELNVLNPGNKDDLINAAEAQKVRSELLRDGQVELQALQTGDPSLLSGGDTGRRLEKESQQVAANNVQGVFERVDNKVGLIRVGHLVDPNDGSVNWCVQEKGTATIRTTTRDGTVVSQRSFGFDGKFWLKRVGDRYLIVDALVEVTQ